MAWSSFPEIEKAALELTSLKVPARAQKVVFQQFQAGHGYEKLAGTGTLSEDTTDFVIGTQSLKLATAGDGVQTQVRKKSVGPYDFTARDLRLTFKVEGLAHVGTFEVFLSSDNLATNNVHYPVSIPVQPYIADGEWAAVTISKVTKNVFVFIGDERQMYRNSGGKKSTTIAAHATYTGR